MKTNFIFKSAAVFAILLFSWNLNAHGMLANYNSSEIQKNLAISFYKTDSVVVVVPDNYILTDSDKTDAESYFVYEKNFKKPVYIYKKESEINNKDKKKHILFYGSFCDFKCDKFSETPFRKISNGFKFRNQIFDQPSDAFYYVNQNAKRMYVCKNSKQLKVEIFSIGLGKFPMHVFRGNEIVLTGVYL